MKNSIVNDIFSSRKAQALLLLAVIVLFGTKAGMGQEQVVLIAEGLMAYTLGRAIHDNGLGKTK